MHWRVVDTSVEEIRFSDVWTTRQWEGKRIIDVSGTRQATKKNIKCWPLTCQPHVKDQKKSKCLAGAFYCWRVVHTSVVSKMKKSVPKMKFHYLTCQPHVNTEGFFSHLAWIDVSRHVSRRKSLQWRVNHTSALGKSWRLEAEGFWTEAACIYVST